MEFLNNKPFTNQFSNQSLNSISIYLDKYKNIGFEVVSLKKVIIAVVKDICDIDLKKEDIIIQNKVLKIKVSGVLKTEIFIHQSDIEKEIELRLKSLNLKFNNRKII